MEERSSHAVMVMDSEDFSDHCSIASVTAGNIFVHFFILLHYRFSAHISKAAILAILIIMFIYWFINQELIIIVTYHGIILNTSFENQWIISHADLQMQPSLQFQLHS